MRSAPFSLVVLAILACPCVMALSDCDPLDPSICLFPFPNNFWLRSNATTGKLNLQFGSNSFPKDGSGKGIDAQKGGWGWLDGFSAVMPITTYFPNVSIDALPHYWLMNRSLEANCPSALVDTVTGAIVPHWTELDFSSGADVNQALIMWPSQRLVDGRRYIVAYRSLVKTTGAPIVPSAAFQALRDNITTTDPDVETRRVLFADIFSRLGAVGFSRQSLTLAWDFTVGTRDSFTSKMIFIRDDAFRRVAATGGVQWKIRSVQDNVSSDIARQVEGTVMVPSYVNKDASGATLVLDSNGQPLYQGLIGADFSLRIPVSLATSATAIGSSLAYGHGLFGSRHEFEGAYLGAQANLHQSVLIATDWIGLSEQDEVPTGLMMATDLTNFGMVPDRCQQGMLNALFAMRLLREGNFAKDPAMTFSGRAVLDKTSASYYTGNSQGGILGTVYMAVSTDVKRGVLGVPGGPYSMLLPRSSDWPELGDILKARYKGSLDRQALFGVLQLLWDRADPGPYMGYITSNPLPNTPNHEVIVHHALGDKQVTYVGAYTLGRSVGASIFESNVNEPGEAFYGFPVIKDATIGRTAMLVTWDFPGIPPVPRQNVAPSWKDDTHGWPRKEQTAQDMMWHFFNTGEIVNTCKGPCHGTPH